MVIRKRPREHLHDVFSAHDVSESDPRDLYNLLRTCRTLYEYSKDISRGDHLLSRFYINIPGPVQQESLLVHQIGSGKLQIFVMNPKWQRAREPVVQRDFRGPRNFDSIKSIRPQQLNEHSDTLVDMLSRQCLRWISTFVHWPIENPGGLSDDSVANPNPMANLRQNFLGVTNFHQYDRSARPRNGGDEDVHGDSGYRNQKFWAMICHCKRDTFLILYNARGTIWDRSFVCPRVAMVTST